MLRIALYVEPHLSRLIALSCGVIVLSAFLYGFLLLEAVGHTAARSSAEKQIRAITSELGSLEAAYLSQTKEVTPQLAQQLGFVTPSLISVVFAGETALSLNAGQ